MKHNRLLPAAAGAVFVVLFVSVVFAAGMEQHLDKSVQTGKALFLHGTFGGNGSTCETCHSGGGTAPGKMPHGMTIPSLANAAAVYPRFNPRVHRVITLEDQIRNCIIGALHGKPPEYGSLRMNALVSYITSLSQGKPIDMGGKPE